MLCPCKKITVFFREFLEEQTDICNVFSVATLFSVETVFSKKAKTFNKYFYFIIYVIGF